MVELNWTLGAIDDLDAIATYIANDSTKYAAIQVQKIRERARQITIFPRSGRIVPELEDESIRELIEGSYRLIYKIVSDDYVDILTVHHSSRLLNNNPNL